MDTNRRPRGRLHLKKDTLRILSSSQMAAVAGGTWSMTVDTQSPGCSRYCIDSIEAV